MIERQWEGEKEQSKDTYRQVIYTKCLKITPAGADIICLLTACLCLALYNRGKGSGAQGASSHHCFGPWVLTGSTLHQPVTAPRGQGPGILLPEMGLEIPGGVGYRGMLSHACPIGGLTSSTDRCPVARESHLGTTTSPTAQSSL